MLSKTILHEGYGGRPYVLMSVDMSAENSHCDTSAADTLNMGCQCEC